jgi:hypothetical protein
MGAPFGLGRMQKQAVTYTILVGFGHAKFKKSPIFMAVLRYEVKKSR